MPSRPRLPIHHNAGRARHDRDPRSGAWRDAHTSGGPDRAGVPGVLDPALGAGCPPPLLRVADSGPTAPLLITRAFGNIPYRPKDDLVSKSFQALHPSPREWFAPARGLISRCTLGSIIMLCPVKHYEKSCDYQPSNQPEDIGRPLRLGPARFPSPRAELLGADS